MNATLGALPVLVSYMDRDLIYRYVNATYEKWFGLTSAECVGRFIGEVLGPTAFATLRPYIDRALNGERQEFEREMPYQHGGTRYVSVSYIPDINAAGDVSGIYVVVQDISAQVQAKLLVQQKEEALEKILDSLPALIGHWDKDMRNLHANRAYTQYFGVDPKTIKGKHIREVLGPALFERNKPYIEAVLRGEAQTFERELQLADGGGSRPTIATYLPEISDGQVNGFYVIVTDLSAVKKLEKERREMEAKVIYSAKMASLGEMAGGLAHEINTPLSTIAMNASTLKGMVARGNPDQAVAIKALESIENTVFRIAEIVKILRTFARDGISGEAKAINVGQILKETLALCTERFKSRGIELRVMSVPVDWAVLGQETQIMQVLINLLNNAFDAVENLAERWVEMRVVAAGDRVTISVTDSGPGIAPEIREKLMEPFFSTKPMGHGMGIGLSTSLGIANHFGGELNFDESCPNTRFNLTLIRAYAGGADQ